MNEPVLEIPPESELPGRSTEWVRAIVRRVLKADQVHAQAKLADVERVWLEALGPLGVGCYVRGLRSGVLHVGVSNPAAVCEIVGYYEKAAIARLRAELPGRGVRRVKYAVLSELVSGTSVDEASETSQ